MKAGISGETFDRSLAGVRIDRDVIEANEAQPEFTKPVWEYLEGALSDTRVAKGRALLAENKALLDRIEAPGYQPFVRPAQLSRLKRLWIYWRTARQASRKAPGA